MFLKKPLEWFVMVAFLAFIFSALVCVVSVGACLYFLSVGQYFWLAVAAWTVCGSFGTVLMSSALVALGVFINKVAFGEPESIY